jgi:tetratricopeptide (TPR) repeat protein
MERVAETVRTPTVISQLGDLYALVGLNREAVNLYLTALRLPAMVDDAEAQASTLYHLGLAYDGLGELNQAWAKYEEALRIYERLGDKTMVMRLKGRGH